MSRINEIISNEEDGDWRNNPSFHPGFIKSALLALLENLQPSKIMKNEPSAQKLGRNEQILFGKNCWIHLTTHP